MLTAWRIVKAKYADQAFSGEGARRYGGRWNSPGTAVIYTSGSISLCTLEILVRLQETSLLSAYVLFRVQLVESQVSRLDRSLLPENWRDYPAPQGLALLGEAWITDRESVALEVPSAIVETESNYLINAVHPDFASLQIEGPFPYPLDPRLVRN